jgi:oxygen-independent coproporphyrinogen-3 oxidase
MKYWNSEPYIGIGPAAHSDYRGKRTYCPKNLIDFLDSAVQKNVLEDTERDFTEEYVMLSLRTSEGINRRRLEKLGGADFAEAVFKSAEPLAVRGLVNLVKSENDCISLTDEGFLLSNSIIAHFLDC